MSETDWPEPDPADVSADVAFAEKYGLIALIDKATREVAEERKAKLAAGVDAERAEEIRIWLIYNKKSLARAEFLAREITHPSIFFSRASETERPH
jgi:hypothetical protein